MKPIVVAAIVIVVAGASFFGGTKFKDYQLQKQRTNFAGGQFFRQDANGQTRISGNGPKSGGERPIQGEIISSDDKSATVKLADGSTKIIILTDSTSYAKTSDGSKEDLKTGTEIGIFGTTNSDGSITAQNVQLNPMFRTFTSASPTPQKVN